MTTAKSEHYTKSGVDIDAADALIERIKPLAAKTRIPGVSGGIGGFGGVFDLAAAGFSESSPNLVAGTDGVGTKLKVAFATGKHDTIGIDCVAMCVNDILALGAKPLFFLDYFATGRLDPEVGEAVVRGIARGCEESGCALLGGETAEMPGMYPDGEYDLAGFVVGAVNPDAAIRSEHTERDDVVIGLRSSGIHSNGYSLARRVLLDDQGLSLDTPLSGDTLSLGERLLVPTRLYARPLAALQNAKVPYRGVAHITGGGLWENPARSIRPELAVSLDIHALRPLVHPVFATISRLGEVPEREMYRVFNMGVGLTLAVPPEATDAALKTLSDAGESPVVLGQLVSRNGAAVSIEGVSDLPLA